MLLGFALATGLAACGSQFMIDDSKSVPEIPVWDSPVAGEPDVKTIMNNHCNRCHGNRSNRGAKGGFRTDVYENIGDVSGARDMARDLYVVTKRGKMPPEAGSELGPNDLAILHKWYEYGAPESK